MGKRETRSYSEEYKKDAVKLARDIGNKAAADELDIPLGTLNGWIYKVKSGDIDLGMGTQTPQAALTLSTELKSAKEEIKRLTKENAKQKETIELLTGATAFFVERRQK